jgi:hypothetical protein
VKLMRRRLIALLVAGALVWPTLLAAAQWPRWWQWIASEQTPMTWMQSVVLVLAGAGAFLVAVVLRLSGVAATLWWVLGCGLAALAVDERFALHERLRDSVLAPRGVEVPFLPWVAPGDFLILAMAVVGLALLPRVWAAISVDRTAQTALGLAVALAVAAVVVDSIDPASWTVQQERLQQTIEEVVEFLSGLALLAAIILRLFTALLALAQHEDLASLSALGDGGGE